MKYTIFIILLFAGTINAQRSTDPISILEKTMPPPPTKTKYQVPVTKEDILTKGYYCNQQGNHFPIYRQPDNQLFYVDVDEMSGLPKKVPFAIDESTAEVDWYGSKAYKQAPKKIRPIMAH